MRIVVTRHQDGIACEKPTNRTLDMIPVEPLFRSFWYLYTLFLYHYFRSFHVRISDTRFGYNNEHNFQWCSWQAPLLPWHLEAIIFRINIIFFRPKMKLELWCFWPPFADVGFLYSSRSFQIIHMYLEGEVHIFRLHHNNKIGNLIFVWSLYKTLQTKTQRVGWGSILKRYDVITA